MDTQSEVPSKAFNDRDLVFSPFSTTYMHVPMLQSWCDLAIWEKFLNEYMANAYKPEGVKTILEIGTHHGGMSLFLAAQALQRRMQFWTFDKARQLAINTALEAVLGIPQRFTQCDVFSEEGQEEVIKRINLGPHPVLLFCDGGKKDREMNLYVPYLQVGDYVAVHDWLTECHPHMIEKVTPMLESLYDEEMSGVTVTITHFWKKVNETISDSSGLE